MKKLVRLFLFCLAHTTILTMLGAGAGPACLGLGSSSPADIDVKALTAGFSHHEVLAGLNSPTAVRFAPNGAVFVAEKEGTIRYFSSLSDTSGRIVADLRTEAMSDQDRGLLGLAIHPNYPNTPYIYALYTLDAPIGQTPPVYNDTCDNPNGCVVGSRLSKLRVDLGALTSEESVLIEDWCQQYSAHSAGDLAFGPDGALYVSHGEGAAFNRADSGEVAFGNPCNDPLHEGGSFRSQDLETAGDLLNYNGTVLRVDPETGAAFGLPTSTPGKADRIIAYGLRNPFRMAIEPTSGDVFLSDVGSNRFEEINRIPSPFSEALNFGWPCFEGAEAQPDYSPLNPTLCNGINAAAPFYHYNHGLLGASITGLTFYTLPHTATAYPAAYDGALFFGDFAKNWIKVMLRDAAGNLSPNRMFTFAEGVSYLVDLQAGPGGDLFYANVGEGKVVRIRHE